MKIDKYKSIAIGSILITGLLAGCSGDNKSVQNMKEETKEALTATKHVAEEKASEVTAATKEAWNSFSGYTVDKKNDAVAFLETQANKLDKQINALKESTGNATEATKEKMNASIDTLQEKRRDLALQISKMKNATAETWEEVKNETQEKWNDFTQFLEKTRNDFS